MKILKYYFPGNNSVYVFIKEIYAYITEKIIVK